MNVSRSNCGSQKQVAACGSESANCEVLIRSLSHSYTETPGANEQVYTVCVSPSLGVRGFDAPSVISFRPIGLFIAPPNYINRVYKCFHEKKPAPELMITASQVRVTLAIPAEIMIRYEHVILKRLVKPYFFHVYSRWYIYERILAFYKTHVKVYEKFLKGTNPYSGICPYEFVQQSSFIIADNSNDDSESTAKSIALSNNSEQENVGYPPQSLQDCASQESYIYERAHSILSMKSTEEAFLPNLPVNRLPSETDTWKNASYSTTDTTKLFRSFRNILGYQEKKNDDRGQDGLIREAWRVWALRRGLLSIIGIFEDIGGENLIAMRGDVYPTADKDNRHCFQMLTMDVFAQQVRCKPCQPQKHLLGGFKEPTIKTFVAMLVLSIHSLHMEGITLGRLCPQNINIVLNAATQLCLPQLLDFTHCWNKKLKKDDKYEELSDEEIEILFEKKMREDWLQLGHVIIYMIHGAAQTVEEFRANSIQMSADLFNLVEMLLKKQKWKQNDGLGILVDPFLVDLNWESTIKGIE